MLYVEYAEPIDPPNDWDSITIRIPVAEAIKKQREIVEELGLTYTSDEQALDDFLLINWAKIVNIKEQDVQE